MASHGRHRPTSFRPPIPWRLIAVAAILVVLAAATIVYVGYRRVAPPPFGLARNGALLIGTADGDIVTVDPVSGRAAPLVSGSTYDGGPFYSRDGQRFVFDPARRPTGAATALYIANADGSGRPGTVPVRRRTDIGWFDGRRPTTVPLITPTVGGKGTIVLVNLADGRARPSRPTWTWTPRRGGRTTTNSW